jgi:hypothetical protein
MKVSKNGWIIWTEFAYKLINTMTTKKTVMYTPGLVFWSQYEITIAAAVISVGRVIAYEYQ